MSWDHLFGCSEGIDSSKWVLERTPKGKSCWSTGNGHWTVKKGRYPRTYGRYWCVFFDDEVISDDEEAFRFDSVDAAKWFVELSR
jgi:hypothetical protein